MITVLASISIRDGHLPEFIAIFKGNVPNVRKEKGCIEYFPAIDMNSKIPIQKLDGNVVTVVEKWNSLDDLYVHLKAPHMVAYQEKVKGMVESVSLKILQEA